MRVPLAIARLVLLGLAASAAALVAGAPVAPRAPAATEAAGSNAAVVRIGVESEPGDRRFDFPARLLEEALRHAGSRARVERVRGMTQPRMIQSARAGGLDVVVLPSITTVSGGLAPVAFPLRRGLLGVRLLLARPEDAARLASVRSVEVLKRDFVLGYGQGWLDRRIKAELGFRLEVASGYRGLFDMLRGGRFDYLSRGVSELGAELADPRLAGSGMVVVPDIALFFPLDDFFFVRSGQGALRRDIERGLEAMLADGSYNRLLEAYYGEAMRAAAIDRRVILHVVGYPVPEGTPLDRFDILTPVRSQAMFSTPPPR